MKRTIHSARPTSRVLGALGLAALVAVAAACNQPSTNSTPVPALMPSVSITSVKGDTVSELLSAIYARIMENNGVRVTRVDPVSMDRAAYYKALQDGPFQMIPDFSNDLLQYVLDNPGTATTGSVLTTVTTAPSGPATTRAPITVPPTTTASTDTTGATATTGAAATTVAPATTGATGTTGAATSTTLAPTNGRSLAAQVVAINSTIPTTLIAYTTSVAERRPVIACSAATLKALSNFQLFTLTDLASLAPKVTLGAPAAYMTDQAAGLPLLEKVYAPQFKSVVTVAATDMGAAIDNGTVGCVAVDSLDPVIAVKGLTIILDDQYMLPSNAAIALMASTANTPEVTAALDKVAAALTTEKLNQMLHEVQANGTAITVVANAFADNL